MTQFIFSLDFIIRVEKMLMLKKWFPTISCMCFFYIFIFLLCFLLFLFPFPPCLNQMDLGLESLFYPSIKSLDYRIIRPACDIEIVMSDFHSMWDDKYHALLKNQFKFCNLLRSRAFS